jgi:hypothetical protein
MLIEKKKAEIEELKRVNRFEYKKQLRAMGIMTARSADSKNSIATRKSTVSKMSHRNTAKETKQLHDVF